MRTGRDAQLLSLQAQNFWPMSDPRLIRPGLCCNPPQPSNGWRKALNQHMLGTRPSLHFGAMRFWYADLLDVGFCFRSWLHGFTRWEGSTAAQSALGRPWAHLLWVMPCPPPPGNGCYSALGGLHSSVCTGRPQAHRPGCCAAPPEKRR